jgi:hypothetical protein
LSVEMHGHPRDMPNCPTYSSPVYTYHGDGVNGIPCFSCVNDN